MYLERFCEICKIFVLVVIAKFLNVDKICLWLRSVCYSWLWVWIGWPSPLFFWFGSLGLLSLSQHEKKCWMENGTNQIMTSYMMWRTILRVRKKTFLKTGIQTLKHHWKKCVDLKGDYVEKNSCGLMFDYCVIVDLWTFQPPLGIRLKYKITNIIRLKLLWYILCYCFVYNNH